MHRFGCSIGAESTGKSLPIFATRCYVTRLPLFSVCLSVSAGIFVEITGTLLSLVRIVADRTVQVRKAISCAIRNSPIPFLSFPVITPPFCPPPPRVEVILHIYCVHLYSSVFQYPPAFQSHRHLADVNWHYESTELSNFLRDSRIHYLLSTVSLRAHRNKKLVVELFGPSNVRDNFCTLST